MLTPLGAMVPVVTTCPPCSYLWEGKCLVCEEGDTHPGCRGCIDGQLPKPPWYKSDFFVTVTASVLVAVVSTLIVARLERRLSRH
jgi:hypothetical protein